MKTDNRVVPVLSQALVLCVLAACGGGGGGAGGGSGSSGTAPLTVTQTVPADTVVGTSLAQVLSATFSAPIDAGSVGAASFTLNGPGGAVGGSVTLSGSTATFIPAAPLAFDTDYTARLTTAIKDTAGNALAADHVWTFNTGVKLAAGGSHTCARFDNGRIKCWGQNGDGQLGAGNISNRGDQANEMGSSLPTVDLGASRTAVQLVAGGSHTCARLDNGEVKCWGRNLSGQLGLGDADSRGDQPGEMGANLPTVDLGNGRAALQLAAGGNHTCARLDSGQIKCWGSNSFGQLGLGDTDNRGDGPNEMGDFLPAVDLGSGRKAVQVIAGEGHTCALLDNGQVRCWGDNGVGQLGLGTTNKFGDGPNETGDFLPTVDLGSGRTAVQLVAGSKHTCARLDNGQVKCWGAGGVVGLGDNDHRGDQANEMGDNLPPVDLGKTGAGPLALPFTVVGLASGRNHTCARLIDPISAGPTRIKCWGNNFFGQLGLGDGNFRGAGPNEMGNQLPMVDVGHDFAANDLSVLEVVAGFGHTCVHLGQSLVKCWGAGGQGSLGLGDQVDRGDNPNEMGDSLPAVDLGT